MSEEASEKALSIIGKIKAKQWKEMGRTILQVKEFTEAGGISSFGGDIAEAVKLQLEDYFSPLKNEITTMINIALQPFLDNLSIIVNDLTAFIGEGAKGALIGGLVGGVASLFLPGGAILVAIGAIVGSLIEQMFTSGFIEEALKNALEDPFGAGVNLILPPGVSLGMDIGAEIVYRWENFWRRLGWK